MQQLTAKHRIVCTDYIYHRAMANNTQLPYAERMRNALQFYNIYHSSNLTEPQKNYLQQKAQQLDETSGCVGFLRTLSFLDFKVEWLLEILTSCEHNPKLLARVAAFNTGLGIKDPKGKTLFRAE